MHDDQGAIRGRGSSDNPANRFDRLHYEPDPDCADLEGPAPHTVFLRDNSRSIIASNDSPDVGFEKSINPYRGCEHGCAYCLCGKTLILMADGTTKPLEALCAGDLVYGTVRRGWFRRYQPTPVLAHWAVEKPAYRVVLEDGTELIASGDHRFLTERGWKFVAGTDQGDGRRAHLTVNNKLMGIGAFGRPVVKDRDYRVGYLCGMVRGDALLGSYSYTPRPGRSHDSQYQFRLALVDEPALQRTSEYLLDFGIPTHPFVFRAASAGRKAMQGIRTSARRFVDSIERLVAWPNTPSAAWWQGFLGGIFDAEGGYNDGSLRITNSEEPRPRMAPWSSCMETPG